MAPVSPVKPKQFAFTLSEEELRMLHELAARDGRSASNWLRHVIRTTYAATVAKPKKTR